MYSNEISVFAPHSLFCHFFPEVSTSWMWSLTSPWCFLNFVTYTFIHKSITKVSFSAKIICTHVQHTHIQSLFYLYLRVKFVPSILLNCQIFLKGDCADLPSQLQESEFLLFHVLVLLLPSISVFCPCDCIYFYINLHSHGY